LPNRQPRRTLHADEASREITKRTALTTKQTFANEAV
jgi:hypothetical protein